MIVMVVLLMERNYEVRRWMESEGLTSVMKSDTGFEEILKLRLSTLKGCNVGIHV
jgi:hypothetical protein